MSSLNLSLDAFELMTSLNDKKFYVYAHVTSASNDLFYIGSGVKKRPFQGFNGVGETGQRSLSWLERVALESENNPSSYYAMRVMILGEFDSRDEAYAYEKLAIRFANPSCNKNLRVISGVNK